PEHSVALSRNLVCLLNSLIGRCTNVAMAGGLAVHLWKEWGIQILVLASFMLQVVLLIFAGIRRRKASAALRIFLWLAYLMADNIAVYALGHMSLNSRPYEDRLIAFWAPFFLLHLGGQDTITAYSLEDNQLWKRHLLTLLVQVSGASYILYVYIGNAPSLVSATILMFVVGVIKYAERVLALRLANIENLGTTLDIREGEYGRLDRKGDMDAEQEVLLGAHYLFSFCRSEFLDRVPTLGAYSAATAIKKSKHFNGGMYMYGLVEVELSLLYDLLYTKAPMIHTWHGCCIRVVSSVATVAAFLLFQLGGRGAYNGVDIAITYVLLVGAIILEITSVLRALGSTWTCAFLHARKWDRCYGAVMCLRRSVKAASNRRWLQSIGQHNVLDFCVRDKTKLRDRIARATGLGTWWKKLHYSSTIPVTPELKELLMTQMLKTMHDWRKWNIRYVRGQAALTDCGIFDDIGPTVEKDFDECVLVWHIATDIYLHCCPQIEEGHPLVKAIKVLSNYMGFLLVVRPNLLPGGVRRSLFRQNCPDLEKMMAQLCAGESSEDEDDGSWETVERLEDGTGSGQSIGEKDDGAREITAEGEDGNHPMVPSSKNLAKHVLHKHNSEHIGGAYTRAGHLATKLLDNKWNLPNVLEVIFAVWVEFLCYAAHHCTDVSHCRQLGDGGDFLTIIRILVDHIELFGIHRPDTNNGA
uniref:DUF4220 domain-containing protein n=4 Tax=Triticinae TaxID=1648030 RepID=A0A453MXG3_AEGTS